MLLATAGALAFGSLYVAALAARAAGRARGARRPRTLTIRPFSVTILVPTLNEAGYVEGTLRSLRAQLATCNREIVLVDSGSEDATVDLARPFVDRVLLAPRGKLNALAAGVEGARGDVIVEADADGIYPPYFLQEITAPFLDEGVAGAHAPVAYPESPASFALAAAGEPLSWALGKFPGGARAYRKSAFLATGGFDLGIDQKHLPTLWREEEFEFPRRLATAGRIVHCPRAICFKSARRFDPIFVRDARAQRFREEARSGKRFSLRA